MTRRVIPVTLFLSLFFVLQGFAQVDPGVRGGAAGAGAPLASVTANNPVTILNFFNDAKDRFQEIDSVQGTLAGEDGKGLGPRFNSRSCAACHAQPAVGGTAPSVNPQFADATAHGAQNTIPSFITQTGPVREARYIFFTTNGIPDQNKPNGGVEDLYTITGRVDAGPCSIAQPGFAQQQSQNNVIFRIPTPTFGLGLVENIADETLLVNQQNNFNNNQG